MSQITSIARDEEPLAAAMTIDVEDWFQVENLRAAIKKSAWESYESRVVNNTDLMLQILADSGVCATFFVLGWIAERYPALIKRISNAGHEIAAHGYDHELVYNMTPALFKEDVYRCKSLLEDATGKQVFGYRAPSFSITDWAIDILAELEFTYDSSAYPVNRHPRYGQLNTVSGNTPIKQLRPSLTEVCISCLPPKLGRLPWGGGGYFRLIPYWAFRWGVRQILEDKKSYVFYIHPWELDPAQPRISGLKRSYAFRHYVNLDRTEYRWKRLLTDFEWGSVAHLLKKMGKPDFSG